LPCALSRKRECSAEYIYDHEDHRQRGSLTSEFVCSQIGRIGFRYPARYPGLVLSFAQEARSCGKVPILSLVQLGGLEPPTS
jgi:hypothetical protein